MKIILKYAWNKVFFYIFFAGTWHNLSQAKDFQTLHSYGILTFKIIISYFGY